MSSRESSRCGIDTPPEIPMRWKQGRRSSNVEDRRGQRGGGGGIKVGGGLGLLLILGVALLGGDPMQFIGAILGGGSGGGAGLPGPSQVTQPTAEEEELADFTTRVLGMTEDVWQEVFSEGGQAYRPPVLVMFTDATQSACGLGASATGPFYCPPDERIYIDLGFFGDLARMAGIDSNEFDFAGAYVIAHEVGHHVQTLLGISEEVRARRQRLSSAEGNQLSVRQELQADCFAGVWANRAHQMHGILEPGDVEEALQGASAVGDDRLQRGGRGEIVPETFTHGTSEQRMRWFMTGFETGDPQQCDTFGTPSL
jgi:uncharacterized protein